MVFKELQPKSTLPADCLALLKEKNLTNYNGYLLFNLTNTEDIFYQNLEFLKEESIWTKEELVAYTLVAQTIDNDYILATNTSVLVIPTSLNKQDSELFQEDFWTFLTQLENQTLKTRILALN